MRCGGPILLSYQSREVTLGVYFVIFGHERPTLDTDRLSSYGDMRNAVRAVV